MRYLIFLICFASSLGLTKIVLSPQDVVQPTQSTEIAGRAQTLAQESATPVPVSSPPIAQYKWTDLESQDEVTIEYEGYKIANGLKGLTVIRNGGRQLFLTNNNGGWRYGVFGLRDLLKNGRKQLVYLSTTGGNHCCAEFVIVDLGKFGPRIVFRSSDYHVQMGESETDALMTFDIEKDGRLEITQTTTYGLGGCATAANPVTYVGFRYDDQRKRFLPMRRLAPVMAAWIAERRRSVLAENELMEESKYSGIPCGYDSDITAVALSYVYVGREEEGYEYFLKNYRTLDFRKTPPIFDKGYSRRIALKSLAEMRRTLLYNKLYGKIYNRRVLPSR